MIVSLDDNPEVVAVVPTLAGNMQRLRNCVESLFQSSFEGRLAVMVVWNDPRQHLVELGPVTILEPGMNLGLPGGMNYARSALSAPQMWIVQDDMTADPNCLQSLLNRQEQPDNPAIVSPIILNEMGLVPALSRAGTVSAFGVLERWFPFEDCPPAAIDGSVRLDWVSLSGALVQCDAWDAVGGMDAAFFPLMHSDVDFGFRVTRQGMSAVLEPTAVISHERNGSTPGVLGHYLSERNAERFHTKHQRRSGTEQRNLELSDFEIIRREASLLTIDFAQYVESQVNGIREVLASLEVSLAEQHQIVAGAQEQVAELAAVVEQRDAELDHARSVNQQLRESRSMRVTRPLRALGTLARRIAKRSPNG